METDKNLDMARTLALRVKEAGGCAYYVGGCVRDALMGLDNKDIDIELHGVTPARAEAILDSLGQRLTMGESFGIYGLKGYDIDIALPRKEKLRGVGHKDFDVFVDPFIGAPKAALRRDFTVNALMQDVLTGEIVDPFGGQEDLRRGVLRHVNDETFAEDPLRVLRGAQFAARFNFTVAPETIALCSGMTLRHLPRERIEGELKKALLKAGRPSVFFEVLRQMDRLQEWFPEVEALIGVPQDPRHHGEGDVWTHTLMVLDAAAALREQAAHPFGFMLAALTHDFGKAVSTQIVNGRIHAYEHEKKGLPLAEAFLRRLTGESRLIDYVLNLAEHHMKPNVVAAAGSALKTTNRMFDQSADPEGLIALSLADVRGQITAYPPEDHEPFLRERLNAYRAVMAQPFVAGRDLIAAGLQPGADFSEILAYAHKLRLAGIAKDPALKQTLQYARKLRG